RGQPQCALIGAERDDGLGRALAERTGAENGGALVVLQGARHDFRSRRRAAVDQDDDLLAFGEIARLGGVTLIFGAPAQRDDLAALEQVIGYGDHLVQQSAGIVAQVDDVSLEVAVGDLIADARDRLLETFLGLIIEGRDADVADIAAVDVPAYGA